jgi:hypothetical protein
MCPLPPARMSLIRKDSWTLTFFIFIQFYFFSYDNKGCQKKIGQLKIWTKNASSRAITQPKLIRPKRNSNLNSSRYSHIPNIKSIYQRTSRKVWTTDILWYIDLIFGMWLYLDELQFKFEFRFGGMIFGWVMTPELVI